MAGEAWCFDSSQTTEQRKEAIAEFKGQFEKIHDALDNEAWIDLVSNFDLEEIELESYKTKKPAFDKFFNLFFNYEGVGRQPFKEPRELLKRFSTVNENYAEGALRVITLKSNSPTAKGEYSDELISQFIVLIQNPAYLLSWTGGRGDLNIDRKEALDATVEVVKELNKYLKSESKTASNNKIVAKLRGFSTRLKNISVRDGGESGDTYALPGGGSGGARGLLLSLIKDIDKAITKLNKATTAVTDKWCKSESYFENFYLIAIATLNIKELDTRDQEKEDAKNAGKTSIKDGVAQTSPSTKRKREALAADAAAREETIAAALAEQVIFQEQCFVLANLGELVNHKKELPTSLPLPYHYPKNGTGAPLLKNYPIHAQGSAFAFVNKLAVHPFTAELFDLKEEEISSLTPRMRFFKVDSGDDGSDVETEITFDNNITKESLESYLKSGGRGIGVGVNSFDFSYDGTDPFSAKKAISAKLSIYATSFSDLLTERTGTNGMKYSYVDLALKTGRNVSNKIKLTEIEKLNIDKLNFRLKAVVQWVAEKEEARMLRPNVKDAVYNSAISFYLTPTIHEFDFDETGAVNFTINYLAYIEDYFAQPQFDVFASTTADKQARDLVYDYYRQKGCDISTDEFSELRNGDEDYITKINSIALQSIVNSLRKQQKIYYISISKKEMKDWLKSPTKNDYIKTITNTPTNAIETNMVNAAANKAKTAVGDDGDIDVGAYRLSLVANSDLRQNVAIFYLSDLVSVVLQNIEDALIESENVMTSNYYKDVIEKMKKKGEIDKYIKDRLANKTNPKFAATLKQFEKMRIVLGPMEVAPYGDLRNSTPSVSCTLGDIPISLNYFLDFMSEKVLSNDFIKYPLSKFIKDMINDCIKNFLNSSDCFRSNASQKISLNSTTVLGYNTLPGDAEDDLSNLIIGLKDTSASSKNCLLLNQVDKKYFPILKISGPADSRGTLSIDTMRNYYIFSAGKRYPTDLYAGNKSQDAEHGIFHYLLGANRGIVKNISLDKTSTPGLKELRFEQEGFDGLEQLREVYNANITTFLNPQTFPGTYIYVEPRGFDPKATEDLTRFGIGGYYMIVKTSHSIKPGDAETTLNAAWVASKGGKAVKATTGTERDKRNVKEGSEQAQKCLVKSVFKTDNRGTN